MAENSNIYVALAKAKKNFAQIKKDKNNSFFHSKYADLESIHKAIDPALESEGLVVLQNVYISAQGDNVLRTELVHAESRETIKSEMILRSKDDADPQKVGAAITYYRRYLLAGLLSIVADEDVDGSQGQTRSAQAKTSKSKEPPAEVVNKRKYIFVQLEQLGKKYDEKTKAAFKKLTGKDSSNDWTLEDAKKIEAFLDEKINEKGKLK